MLLNPQAKIHVMGILNVTPDSFSDGGLFYDVGAAVKQADLMIGEGADIIDVGGESTRPGAEILSVQQELERVIPVVEAIKKRFDVLISIDTSKTEVMQEALTAGAGFINDVRALKAEGAIELLAHDELADVQICLMHMKGEPGNMQDDPQYKNVVEEVKEFLQERMDACVAGGIVKERLIIDPGFGFGKSLEHNLQLLNSLEEFQSLNALILVGTSRKSMIGKLIDRPADQRLYGGIALTVLAARNGAAIIRTHDVRPTVEALKMIQAVNEQLES